MVVLQFAGRTGLILDFVQFVSAHQKARKIHEPINMLSFNFKMKREISIVLI